MVTERRRPLSNISVNSAPRISAVAADAVASSSSSSGGGGGGVQRRVAGWVELLR